MPTKSFIIEIDPPGGSYDSLVGGGLIRHLSLHPGHHRVPQALHSLHFAFAGLHYSDTGWHNNCMACALTLLACSGEWWSGWSGLPLHQGWELSAAGDRPALRGLFVLQVLCKALWHARAAATQGGVSSNSSV